MYEFVRDINGIPGVELYTDSQVVKLMLEELGCDEDYGGLFIVEGKVYGFEGIVPYIDKRIYEIGEWS